MRNAIRNWCMIAVCVLAGRLGASVGDLTVTPRWGMIWLSPRLSANWVMLRYRDPSPAEAVPVGDVVIELPARVRCLWVFGSGGHVSHTDLSFRQVGSEAGGSRLTLLSLPLDGTQGVYLYLSTDLAPGTRGAGRSWAEVGGAESSVSTFTVQVVDTPVARQPRRIMTGIAMWPYMIENWPDFYAQFAGLGFNHMDLWHGAIHVVGLHPEAAAPADVRATLAAAGRIAAAARERGIRVSINASGSWDDSIIRADPDAQALFASGTRTGPCPSYRGPGFREQIRRNAAIAGVGIFGIQSDEELYGGGNYTTACVCPRCAGRWQEWLAGNRPGLEYVAPADLIGQRVERPELYRAWLWFRASLTTERYRIYRRELARAAAPTAVAASNPAPRLGWWAGATEDWTLEMCMQDGRALADVIDQVIPQLYFRYTLPPRHFRAVVRRQSWALAGRNCYAGIDSDTPAASRPGNLALAVLETLLAGGDGYCVWYGPGTDTRQWAELAKVNAVVAEHEQTFLTGAETDLFRAFCAIEVEGLPKDYFRPWSDDVCTATWETATEGLLLISDYREERDPIWVERSRKYAGPMTLRDAFSGATVAELTAGQWDFRIHLEAEPFRLLAWRKTL